MPTTTIARSRGHSSQLTQPPPIPGTCPRARHVRKPAVIQPTAWTRGLHTVAPRTGLFLWFFRPIRLSSLVLSPSLNRAVSQKNVPPPIAEAPTEMPTSSGLRRYKRGRKPSENQATGVHGYRVPCRHPKANQSRLPWAEPPWREPCDWAESNRSGRIIKFQPKPP